MPPIDFLFLSLENVAATGLTMAVVMDIVEATFGDHGRNQYENPPKPGIHTRNDAFIHAMPAYLKRTSVAGMKWVSGYSANALVGLPSIMGMIILNDTDTGRPLAVMDAALVTALRTAAVSGVAAKYLAAEAATTVGIVGAGVQGRYHLMALKSAMQNLSSVAVYDIHRPTLEAYVAYFDGHLPLAVHAAESVQATIEGADVVVTATGRLDNVVYDVAWVKPGALILPVHMFGWPRDAITGANKFVVDDWNQFSTYINQHGKVYTPLPKPFAELGEIVVGRKPGRENPGETIINFNLGIAIHDIAVATKILAKARSEGLGTSLTLMHSALPYAIP